MSNEPLLLIVSSPSGAGKTTLTTALRERISDIHFSVSHTTRKPRSNEANGREYHFVERPRFEDLIRAGEFLEWASVHDNLYGTSRGEIDRAQGARGLLFDVDHQGARQIKSRRPNAVGVFILPPSMPELERRLHGRASEDEATIFKRFTVASGEIQHYGLFDYVLVNDEIERSIERLVAIFLAEECRRPRVAHQAERLLAEAQGFGGNEPPA